MFLARYSIKRKYIVTRTNAINGRIGYRVRASDNMRDTSYLWHILRARSRDELWTLWFVVHSKAPGAMIGTESGIKV